MGRNINAGCRFPSSPFLLLLFCFQKTHFKQSSKSTKIFLYCGIDLCLTRLTYSIELLSAFNWDAISSCFYCHSHFCIPVRLQCFILTFPEFTEIHPFNHQFHGDSHHLLYPSYVSRWLWRALWSLQSEVCYWVHMQHCRIRRLWIDTCFDAALFSEGS